jgi:hypothetical protein
LIAHVSDPAAIGVTSCFSIAGSAEKLGPLTYLSSGIGCFGFCGPPKNFGYSQKPRKTMPAMSSQRDNVFLSISAFSCGAQGVGRVSARGREIDPSRVKRVALTQP